MKNWIIKLCPEIADWQVEMIAEQAQKAVDAEREACAKLAEQGLIGHTIAQAIRARGNVSNAAPSQPNPPPECKTEAEKIAFAFGWWKAIEAMEKKR
jgi:hypothetical protein